MPHLSCLFPDCDVSVAVDFDDIERAKRIVIDHINHDHDEAHVLIGCVHQNEHIEYVDEEVLTPQGKFVLHRERLQCVRCQDFTLRDVVDEEGEPSGEEADS